jgi:hypothetical protein
MFGEDQLLSACSTPYAFTFGRNKSQRCVQGVIFIKNFTWSTRGNQSSLIERKRKWLTRPRQRKIPCNNACSGLDTLRLALF